MSDSKEPVPPYYPPAYNESQQKMYAPAPAQQPAPHMQQPQQYPQPQQQHPAAYPAPMPVQMQPPTTNVIVTGGAAQHPSGQVMVIGGGCPACKIGHLGNEFTVCGICLAIIFFPIGVLCCLAMTEKRCANCGLTFG